MQKQYEKQMIENECIKIANMCMATGIQKWVYEGQNRLLSHMPVSLYPYELSEKTYLKIKKAHEVLVKLILKVSKDTQFVKKVFSSTAQSDPFVKRFLNLYQTFIGKQTYGAACIRVDYMGDQNPQLVQFNLISVGLNGISDRVQNLTSLLKKNPCKDQKLVYYPISRNQQTVLNSIQQIVKLYNIQGIIVMVVHQKHQKQFNFGDQMSFELEAMKRGFKVRRVSMTEFISLYKLSQNNDLLLENQKVAVVYYRTAYSPDHYISEQYWKLREDIQNSNSLKFPTISMQLLNFKRMQVQLSKIQVLKKYLNEEQAQLINSLTGQIYDFEDHSQLQKIIETVKNGDFVLKTNREGGGNNYFGQNAYKILLELKQKPEQLQKYILMKKIPSIIQSNVFITKFTCHEVKETTCQMSTFGSFSYKNDEIIYNQFGGNLIRIKRADQNQGGIAIDKAVISGICVKRS